MGYVVSESFEIPLVVAWDEGFSPVLEFRDIYSWHSYFLLRSKTGVKQPPIFFSSSATASLRLWFLEIALLGEILARVARVSTSLSSRRLSSTISEISCLPLGVSAAFLKNFRAVLNLQSWKKPRPVQKGRFLLACLAAWRAESM